MIIGSQEISIDLILIKIVWSELSIFFLNLRI